jgi:hypothetical protein
MRAVLIGWSCGPPSWSSKGTGHRREQVHVDEGAGEREEDLLHGSRSEDARKIRPGNDRHVHQQCHHRADVGWEEAVHRHAGGVSGKHLLVLNPRARESRSQNEVPGKSGERGLDGLRREADKLIPDGAGRHGIPEIREPAAYVHSDELE